MDLLAKKLMTTFKFTVVTMIAASMLVLTSIESSLAAPISGNPLSDGWSFRGNSLYNGTYVRGGGNYAFDVYTTQFTVTDASAFDISDHDDPSFLGYYETAHWTKADARPWQVGHTVIGVGGAFNSVTADDAGWDAFTGNTVNGGINGEYRLRLQAKIGSEDATWSASSVAPGAGDGSGSTSDGGAGAFLIRTSGWHSLDAWESFGGEMLGLQKEDHISSTNIGVDAARVIWTWDDASNRVGTWELLINMSLVEEDLDAALFTGPLPGLLGDSVIASVQVGGGAYTDALAQVAVPEPSTIALAGIAGLAGVAIVRRRRKS